MTTKKRPSCTAAELLDELQASPEYVERQRVLEEARAKRRALIRTEQEPILAGLREVGFHVQSVWDFVNTSDPYPEAISILLAHLVLPYSDVVKEGIARALAVPVPHVQAAWPILSEEFRNAPSGWGIKAFGDIQEFRLGAKDGLACALTAAVTDETLTDLIALTMDRTHGESRVLLLSALRERWRKNPLVKSTIECLANDPQLKKEIASWKII